MSSIAAPPGAPPWPGPDGPFDAVRNYIYGITLEARRYINAWSERNGRPTYNIFSSGDAYGHPFYYWPLDLTGVVDAGGIHDPGQHAWQGTPFTGTSEGGVMYNVRAYYNAAATAANAGNPLPPPPPVVTPPTDAPPPVLPPGTPPLPPADSGTTLPPGTPPPPVDGEAPQFPQCGPGYFFNILKGECQPLPSTTTPPAPVESATAVLLLGGRYRVEANYATTLLEGEAKMVPLTTDSAVAWFFTANNVELLFKVVGDITKPWFFASGCTDVSVNLTLTDTVTGESKTYTNPMGTLFAPIADLNPFGRA